MTRCLDRCPALDTSTHLTAWTDARTNYGPHPQSLIDADRLDLYNEDLGEYSDWLTDWNTTHSGTLTDTPQRFGEWLIWRFNVGTTANGNLPQRKRDHVGISCVTCPYDTQADDVRSTNMLGSVPSKVDHGIYYMKVAQRGTSWGFECTYSGCPHLSVNGVPYFYA